VTRLVATLRDRRFDVEISLPPTGETWARLRDLLPWEGELHHARVGGEELLACLPMLVRMESPAQILDVEPGTLCYWPDRGLLTCFYGAAAEAEDVTLVGRIVEGLDELRRVGEQVRELQGARLRLEEAVDDA
jgi:hypothetical protein